MKLSNLSNSLNSVSGNLNLINKIISKLKSAITHSIKIFLLCKKCCIHYIIKFIYTLCLRLDMQKIVRLFVILLRCYSVSLKQTFYASIQVKIKYSNPLNIYDLFTCFWFFVCFSNQGYPYP